MHLDITKERAVKLEALENKAIDVLMGVMDGYEVDDQAKVAMQIMGAVSKARSNHTTRNVLQFNMAKFIADPQQMSKYIAATQPQIKRLMGGKQNAK